MSRGRLYTLLAAVIVLVFTLPGNATSAPSLDMSPAKIRFGNITGIAFPTLIVAMDQGFFAKENLTVEKINLQGSGPVSEALAAGNVDMGNTTPSSSVLATMKGARTIMVSGYEYTFIDKSGKSWEATYAVVRSGEGIKKLTDLKGKRVAINDIGSAYNYMLRERMIENKIDPDKDMTIVPIPFGQMSGALMQKQVDAMLSTADGYLQAKRMGAVDIIGTHTSLEKLDMGLSSAIGVNNAFLQKNPDAVVRFLRAFVQARKWMAEDVAKNGGKNVKDLVAKSMNYSPERAQAFYETRGGYYGKDEAFVNLLDIPERLIRRQYEILKAAGLIKPDTPADYAKVVNIGPLKKAYETLGLRWDDSKH